MQFWLTYLLINGDHGAKIPVYKLVKKMLRNILWEQFMNYYSTVCEEPLLNL